MNSVARHFLEVQDLDDVNSGFDQQMHVYGHVRRGYPFKGHSVGSRGKDPAAAQPACGSDFRTGSSDARDKLRGVIEEAGPAGAQQDDIACANINTGVFTGRVEMFWCYDKVLRERLDSNQTRDVEQHAAPDNRLNGVNRKMIHTPAV